VVQSVARLVGRWYVALACVTVLAAAVLLPGLNQFGLWEPQERQLADKAAPRDALAKQQAAEAPKPPPIAWQSLFPKVGDTTWPVIDTCLRQAPSDALARTLTTRAAAWGRDHLADSDGGRRLPFALFGLLTVLATAGIAMRTIGSRAGVLAALVVLSMPLLVLQSRQITSEIGTAAGSALIIYGLLAVRRARDVVGAIASLFGRVRFSIASFSLASVDTLVGALALSAGLAIGFAAGGALLGLLVPLGAFAAANLLGIPAVVDMVTAIHNGALRGVRRFAPRLAVGRRSWAYREPGYGPALLATLVALGLLGLLVYQLFSLREPQPGLIPPQRALLGKAIVPSGCWSTLLGGMWRPDDDLRYIYDSTFEQIAYGTFPWGILAPIAIASLIASAHRGRRQLGAIALAWAGGAWIAAEVFQRKVGFSLWAGFPALAVAVGGWLDGVLIGRARGQQETADTAGDRPHGTVLIGVFVALGIAVLGKDLQSFSERLTSLLVGSDAVPYPSMSKLVFVPTRLWVLLIGGIIGLGFALAMIAWRDDAKKIALRDTARIGAIIAIVGTVVMAAFWSFVWQPMLATHLSSKAMFDSYRELRKPGDTLVIMKGAGDLGDAPFDYVPETTPEVVQSREQLVSSLGRPGRVFAIAPQTELCQLHREIGGKPYFVVDDRNTKSLLLANHFDGTDKNPLRATIVHAEPKDIPIRPTGKIVFDDRIQLLGWDIPKSVERGSKFQVKMFYKVLQPVGGTWKILFHFDGGLRFNGDHEPIGGRCQTSTWQPNDYIIDSYTVLAGGGAFAAGSYEVWTGFFTGSAPNWKNMKITDAPRDRVDGTDRVKITTITLE
jgi:hypothetical protein